MVSGKDLQAVFMVLVASICYDFSIKILFWWDLLAYQFDVTPCCVVILVKYCLQDVLV